ncbi:Bet v1-like protein [Dioscorea alata]|uniref:Bet v1-like protein n=1 Tax=Dioscorea alata TaxID=55571 RepID=A0ACB7TYP5_DIOAL|nr:Bet v1-like protein [Dioscorea alata]
MEDTDILDTDENELQRLLEDELEEDSEFGSNTGEQNPRRVARRKKFHRHTQRQIHEMEALFRECPHPDDKQRKELSRALGLEPLQVKFWFQNKRTQIKAQNERQENSHLREENVRLSSESTMMREALRQGLCIKCGGCGDCPAMGEWASEGNDIRAENAKLKGEIERISAIVAKYVGKQPMNSHQHSPPVIPSLTMGTGLGVYNVGLELVKGTGIEKQVIIELAVASMDEVIGMAQLGEPLWMSRIDWPLDTLNEGIYNQSFLRGLGMKLTGLKTEATRQTVVVPMKAVNIIEMLMDANRWMAFFPSIVSRGATLDVYSRGAADNFDGALQVMSAMFQMATPLVPRREGLFVRYCKQHAEKTWAVVDVSLDGLRPNPSLTWRRRPSGCLIQEMSESFSKVTWVEHMEVDDTDVAEIYKPLVNSGLAFGAQRWALAMKRQCHRIANVNNDAPVNRIGVLTSVVMRKNLMKLSERMVRIFANGVSSATSDQWSLVAGTGANNGVRATTRKRQNQRGCPPGIILNATTSVWLQVPTRRLFEFLHSETSRCQWDILTNNGVIEEVSQVADGGSHGNCITLLHVKNESLHSSLMLLQESSTDASGAYVIYAPLDDVAMGMVLDNSEPDLVELLPSGFAVLPDGPVGLLNERNTACSLLTVSFQILLHAAPSERIPVSSITAINNLIAGTVDRIKSAVSSGDS